MKETHKETNEKRHNETLWNVWKEIGIEKRMFHDPLLDNNPDNSTGGFSSIFDCCKISPVFGIIGENIRKQSFRFLNESGEFWSLDSFRFEGNCQARQLNVLRFFGKNQIYRALLLILDSNETKLSQKNLQILFFLFFFFFFFFF